MKARFITRTLAIVLTSIFSISFTLKAQFASGDGSKGDPYVITTAEQLNDIRNHLDKHFKLGNDIDLTAFLTGKAGGWEPIGTNDTDESSFRGSLDGDGHFITGIWMDRPQLDGVGLFGYVLTTEIKKLGLVISEGKEVKGLTKVGGLIGATRYSSTPIKINECAVFGNVTSTGECAGGIIGYSSNNGAIQITDCYTDGIITASDKAGGLLGQAYRRIEFNSSYSAAKILATNDAVAKAGGLAGEIGFPNLSPGIRHDVNYCMSLNSSITGTETFGDKNESGVGRLIGYEKLNESTTDPNYWYMENYAFNGVLINGATVSNGEAGNKNGLNKTKDEVLNADIYFGQNTLYWFDDVWTMGNEQYPLPVLINLSKEYQPKKAPAHLGGGSYLPQNKADELVIYPNPVIEQMQIKNKPQNTKVGIYDYTGRMVLESMENVIDVSSLSNGIYFVTVAGQTAKIVKK